MGFQEKKNLKNIKLQLVTNISMTKNIARLGSNHQSASLCRNCYVCKERASCGNKMQVSGSFHKNLQFSTLFQKRIYIQKSMKKDIGVSNSQKYGFKVEKREEINMLNFNSKKKEKICHL